MALDTATRDRLEARVLAASDRSSRLRATDRPAFSSAAIEAQSYLYLANADPIAASGMVTALESWTAAPRPPSVTPLAGSAAEAPLPVTGAPSGLVGWWGGLSTPYQLGLGVGAALAAWLVWRALR